MAHATPAALDRARAGDDLAFDELTAPYRGELQLHCYRMLGSVQDAEDMLQETLFAAWRGLGAYAERASLRTWLFRIATNQCLNALRASGRRPRTTPLELPFAVPEPSRLIESGWIEPYPDTLLDIPPAQAVASPEARYAARETIALAFTAALQALPPRQRAVLVLRDVLGFSAAEAAGVLDTSETAVNSALQRARQIMSSRLPTGKVEDAPLPRSTRERDLVERFAAAYADGDVGGVVALLTDDAWLSMPPVPLEYQGQAAIAAFLRESFRWRGGLRQRLIPTRANGQPAFGRYRADAHAPIFHANGLIVLTLAGDRISAITGFPDNGLVARFGLPGRVPA